MARLSDGRRPVRLATTADVDLIAELHARSQRDTYGPLLGVRVTEGIDRTSKLGTWERRLRRRDGAVVVAESSSGRVVGVGAVTCEPPGWATVTSLHVERASQGQGIGRELLTALLAAAADRGCAGAQLSVLAVNLTARRFYERQGWRQHGPAPDHAVSGAPVHTVRYETDLPG